MTTQAATGISWSEILRWDRCRRTWLIEQYFGLLPANERPTSARLQGTRIHTALEYWYGPDHLDPGRTIDLLYGAVLDHYPDDEKAIRAEHEMSKIIVEGYPEWVASEGCDNGMIIVDVEREVRVPLPGWEGAVDLRAKMDMVWQDADSGLLGFLDHKRRSTLKEQHEIRKDGQMRFYSLMQWLAAGHPPPVLGQPAQVVEGLPLVLGGKVNQLKAVKRGPNSKPPYYMRNDFRHTPEIMASHLLGVQQAVHEIMFARNSLDAAGARGGHLDQADWVRVNWIQSSVTKPTWIEHDCTWSCPYATGLCQLMDEGLGWIDALFTSGRFVQGDPYARYERKSLPEQIAELVGTSG
ncbi:MAG TPA: PD-(D/E)XK nuclease family protein [Streptosporangiaceae bacterium]|nr:PD-(D/E)XK nuclease family protein [Streptosporangiaceae bacterium]